MILLKMCPLLYFCRYTANS